VGEKRSDGRRAQQRIDGRKAAQGLLARGRIDVRHIDVRHDDIINEEQGLRDLSPWRRVYFTLGAEKRHSL